MQILPKELPRLIQRYRLQLTELGNTSMLPYWKGGTSIDSRIYYNFSALYTHILGKVKTIFLPHFS